MIDTTGVGLETGREFVGFQPVAFVYSRLLVLVSSSSIDQLFSLSFKPNFGKIGINRIQETGKHPNLQN